jgi:hypothetical protein
MVKVQVCLGKVCKTIGGLHRKNPSGFGSGSLGTADKLQMNQMIGKTGGIFSGSWSEASAGYDDIGA